MNLSDDRPLTRRERLGFAACLALIVAAMATCSACVEHFSVHGWTPREQHIAAVEITITCVFPSNERPVTGDPTVDAILAAAVPDVEKKYRGTGVLISSNRLLTNNHVATCDGGKTKTIEVNTGDGHERPAVAEVLLPANDIARIRLEVPLDFDVQPPMLGPPPSIGDRVCVSTAVPRYSFRCSEIQPSPAGVLYTDDVVLHGNSGSGTYDSQGRLIGLVFATEVCEAGIPCVGAVTPITDELAWLLQ